MTDKGVLEIAHRLVTDGAFRGRFVAAPRETLTELGVSGEVYSALVALAPVLLAGGAFLLTGTLGDGSEIPPELRWN